MILIIMVPWEYINKSFSQFDADEDRPESSEALI